MNSFDITMLLNKLHDFISKPILLALLGLLCIFFGVASFVLIFHWNRYAIDKSSIVAAQSVYFLGGLMIMVIAFASIILY